MSTTRTLFICNATCWSCKNQFKAAYLKFTCKDRQGNLSPGHFTKEEKALTAENGVIIKPMVYPNGDVYTANICPHCNKPYSNNRIDDFVGHEEKEIITLNQK